MPTVHGTLARSILLTGILLLATVPPARAADPGAAIPASSEASDQKPGAILIYNLFTSGKKHDTRISVTNSSETTAGVARLFFVDGTTGAATDRDVCLEPLQTASLQASEVSPGQTGYVVAVAITGASGQPLDFNFLSGQAEVRRPNGHRGTIAAVAYAKLTAANVLSVDQTLAAAFFDGLNLAGSYNRVPRVLQVSDLPSPYDRTSTLVVVNRIGGNLTTSAAQIGNLQGVLVNDLGATAAITTSSATPQLTMEITNGFPSAPDVPTMLPAGRTGWLKLSSPNDVGLSGSVLYGESSKPGKKLPTKERKARRSDGASNLRALTLSPAANLVIPVRPATCE